MKTTLLTGTIHATTVTDEELAIENSITTLARQLDEFYGLNDEFTGVLTNAIAYHVDDLPLCGYCGEKYPVVDQEVCGECLVKVSDDELEEMGLL